jgi:uncharacterized RDD family membrane protein YckC
MTTPDSLTVATPERVALELPIAGLGSRAMAWLVDVSLLGGVVVVLYFAFTLLVPDPVEVAIALSSTGRAVAIAVSFFVLWVYWTLFEVLWRGQTLGKRLVRIRVVKADGSPVGPFESAVRNLLRFIDFLPVCYPVGVATMLIDRQHRRLGDLVAGTVLVREERVDLSRYEAASGTSRDVDTVEVATSFLARFDELEPAARLRIGRTLAARLGLPADEATTAEALRDAVRLKLGAG